MSQNKSDEAQMAEILTLSSDSTPTSNRPSLTDTGKILIVATGGLFAAITALTTPFVLPGLRKICLPFVPASSGQVRNVMALLKEVPEVSKGRLLDIGSGDGRLVIEAARRGYKADGVELNPWLIAYSRYQAMKQGVSKNTRFFRRNLWKYDLSQYSGVIVFGVDSMMEPLRQKISKEMVDNVGIVIACRFPLIGCQVTAEVGEGLDTVWLYKIKDIKEFNNKIKLEKEELPTVRRLKE